MSLILFCIQKDTKEYNKNNLNTYPEFDWGLIR